MVARLPWRSLAQYDIPNMTFISPQSTHTVGFNAVTHKIITDNLLRQVEVFAHLNHAEPTPDWAYLLGYYTAECSRAGVTADAIQRAVRRGSEAAETAAEEAGSAWLGTQPKGATMYALVHHENRSVVVWGREESWIETEEFWGFPAPRPCHELEWLDAYCGTTHIALTPELERAAEGAERFEIDEDCPI